MIPAADTNLPVGNGKSGEKTEQFVMMVLKSRLLALAYDSKVLVQSASGMKKRCMLMRTDWSDDEYGRTNPANPYPIYDSSAKWKDVL